MSKPGVIRVLIADDHPVVREGLGRILGRSHELAIVGQASTGREAVKYYKELMPDILLMDLVMPEMSGIEALQAIRREFPKARIIILTSFMDEEAVYHAFQAGACGYVLKDASAGEFVRIICSVHEGGRHIPPAIAARLTEHLAHSELTERETDVLRRMAEGKSNEEIAKTLGVTLETVKVHIKAVLSKLDAQNRTQAVTEAIKRGLIRIP